MPAGDGAEGDSGEARIRPTIILSLFWVAMLTRSATALADLKASISDLDAKGLSIILATKDATRPTPAWMSTARLPFSPGKG
jgi:hypothetical protein